MTKKLSDSVTHFQLNYLDAPLTRARSPPLTRGPAAAPSAHPPAPPRAPLTSTDHTLPSPPLSTAPTGRRALPSPRSDRFTQSRRRPRLVTSDPLQMPPAKVTRLNMRPSLHHEIQIKMQVVQREQRTTEDLTR